MKRSVFVMTMLALVLLVATAGYWLGSRQRAADAADNGAKGGQEVLYWYDPMYPDRHFDAPGKSPFMDMQLVPKYAEAGEQPGLEVSPAVVQNLGVRTATAKRTPLQHQLSAVGTVQFNDREVAVVQSRADGFVERTYRRAPGDLLPAGAPLIDLLMPVWAGAQTEFLTLLNTGEEALIAAGRHRLRLLGMPDEVIRRVEQSGEPDPLHTVVAPISGALQSLTIRQGMTVRAGDTLARINGLDTVWLDVAVPEAQAERVAAGAPVSARLTAFPGEDLVGEVVDILPQAETRTRTVTVRIELPNPEGRLRPGMFARAQIGGAQPRLALTVPTEAVIRTGERTLVMLAQDGGRFQPAEIVAGRESGQRTVVLDGLREGERVVVSGQFLLDSEASLRSVPVRPVGGGAGSPEASDPTTHEHPGNDAHERGGAEAHGRGEAHLHEEHGAPQSPGEREQAT